MKAFILAAGYGERLRPLTEDTPKPLLPVLNVPGICYSLMLLKEAGISDIMINLHWKPDPIKNFLEQHNNFDLRVTYSLEETILGTGGGLKACEDFFANDTFIVINSDIICDIFLPNVVEQHEKSGLAGTIVVNKNASATPTVSAAGDTVADFKNHLRSGIAPEYDYTGIAVLSPEIFPYLEKGFSSIVYTGYIQLVKQQSLGYYEHNGTWKDIGTFESYRATNTELIRDIQLQSRLKVHTGLSPHSEPDDFFAPFNTIISDSVIGPRAIISEDATIENSLLLPGARVEQGATIRDKIVYGNTLL